MFFDIVTGLCNHPHNGSLHCPIVPFKRNSLAALRGGALGVGCPPSKLSVAGLILVRAHAWIECLVPSRGMYKRQSLMFLSHINVSLPLFPFLPLSLKIN